MQNHGKWGGDLNIKRTMKNLRINRNKYCNSDYQKVEVKTGDKLHFLFKKLF